VAAATALENAPVHSAQERPSIVSVGTIIWLSSELMFFSALFAMYFTVRSVSDVWPPEGTHPKVVYSAIFTIILVLSSVTCQWGVFAAERGDVHGMRRWYALTFLMGLAFVIGQANEYRMEVGEGHTLSSDAYDSLFYLTTGFHFLHVCGGLIAFLFVLARSKVGRYTPAKATSAIVTSYYWHFVDVVWIGLYLTIYVIQ
jgi:cytochrome c oxidase subunit 3